MTLLKKLAYKIVLKDLSKIDLFNGKWDSSNGGESYMFGIQIVLANIAYHISEKNGDEFEKQFFKNYQESIDKSQKL